MAKERDKNLIAYCGLFCGDCFNYTGEVADLARDLRKALRNYRFEETAEFLKNIPFFKEFKDYNKCYAVLARLVGMRCKKTCKGGGGPPFCKIRKCCQNKGFEGCWECDEFERCKKLDFLRPSHKDAHIKNLRIIKKKGVDEFLKGKKYWYSKEKKDSLKTK